MTTVEQRAREAATAIMDSHQRREATIEDITQAILQFATQAVEEESIAVLERLRYHKHKIPHPSMDVGAPYTAVDDSITEGKAEIRGWDEAMASVERVIESDIHALRTPSQEERGG